MARAGDILKNYLSSMDLKALERYSGFFSGWSAIVGPDLASHCRPLDLRDGAVIVEADHPGWMQLLQLKQERILSAISRKFPDLQVRTLHLRLVKEGMWSSPPVREVELPTPPQPEGSIGEAGRGEDPALETIRDTDLREALERLRQDLEARGRRG